MKFINILILITSLLIFICCNFDQGKVEINLNAVYRIYTEESAEKFANLPGTSLCSPIGSDVVAVFSYDNGLCVGESATDETGADAYEGSRYFKFDVPAATNGTVLGYIQQNSAPIDISAYSDMVLKFMIKKVSFSGTAGNGSIFLSNDGNDVTYQIEDRWLTGDWVEASIDLSEFDGLDFSEVKAIFGIIVNDGNSATFYVDHIRIERD